MKLRTFDTKAEISLLPLSLLSSLAVITKNRQLEKQWQPEIVAIPILAGDLGAALTLDRFEMHRAVQNLLCI